MFEKIVNAICDQLGCNAADLTLNTRFVEDLHADSIDMANMLLTLEDEYNLAFGNNDVIGIKTIGDVITVLNAKLK